MTLALNIRGQVKHDLPGRTERRRPPQFPQTRQPHAELISGTYCSAALKGHGEGGVRTGIADGKE